MLDARGVHPLWTTACVYAVLVIVTGLDWRPHLKLMGSGLIASAALVAAIRPG